LLAFYVSLLPDFGRFFGKTTLKTLLFGRSWAVSRSFFHILERGFNFWLVFGHFHKIRPQCWFLLSTPSARAILWKFLRLASDGSK
jgi:hypothetical protein